MAVEKGIAHRPGPFKQSNKNHKHGRHRSKGSINISAKGKISVKTLSKRNKRELNKDQRRHQAVQIRQNKRDEILAKKEVFSVPRFKQRFSFVTPKTDNELAVLDHLKVSDTVLYLISAATGIEDNELLIDKWGHNILTSSFAQIIFDLTGFANTHCDSNRFRKYSSQKRHEFKQQIQKLVNKWLPEEKIMVLDKNSDAVNILRKIGNQKRKSVLYRDRRPHLLGEEIEYVPETEGTLGTLKITGYLRGVALSVNQLVHIPGLGDFQMLQIDAPYDPNKIDKNKNTNTAESSEQTTVRILEIVDPAKQESLDSENIPDPMDAEQTWPTNEEIETAEKEQKLKKVKKIPKGWSDYQAAWIPDDDAEFQLDESASDEQGSDNEYMDAVSEEKSEISEDDNDFESVTESEVPVNDERYDKEMDFYSEKQALEKMKAAKVDRQFPDEVDTPMDQPARVRFQKI
ncbi:hypothetical protein NQ314_016479 [Rhamnusium bicolor]|uniref:Bms1-type G domain-containing protein n=1 Tax=Rhamnusium bicolor TaxID=1586634 RepID=A0AAV8WVL7_9CUCU|nr:hypothetical protein NQ314_016479 [Rhamnusium bicolor]